MESKTRAAGEACLGEAAVEEFSSAGGARFVCFAHSMHPRILCLGLNAKHFSISWMLDSILKKRSKTDKIWRLKFFIFCSCTVCCHYFRSKWLPLYAFNLWHWLINVSCIFNPLTKINTSVNYLFLLLYRYWEQNLGYNEGLWILKQVFFFIANNINWRTLCTCVLHSGRYRNRGNPSRFWWIC